MKDYDMAEQAYRNGYEAGLGEGKPKWNPVTERLPDVYEDRELWDDDPRWWASHPVLALDADGEMTVCVYEINSDGDDYWSERICAAAVKDVRYWMPLPELPKEETP